MGQPRARQAARITQTLAVPVFALVFALAGCAGEPEPVGAPLPSTTVKPAKPKGPGSPTLGDVVDEVQSRRRVIEQLEEIENDEP
jgi:hypothetical protein